MHGTALFMYCERSQNINACPCLAINIECHWGTTLRALESLTIGTCEKPSCLRRFSTSLAKSLCLAGVATGNGSNRSSQGPFGHVLRLGPLSPLLNIVLRAELRLDDVRWVRSRRTRTSSRSAAALQQVWPVPFGLRASLLHSLIGIRLPVSSLPARTSCPGYGYARSSGHPSPIDTRRAFGRREESLNWTLGLCQSQP